jgi:hypothetical protein
MKEQHVIVLNNAEIQSGSDRVRWAEGLILQLPPDHEGRNSWLLNYGRGPEADKIRVAQGFNQFDWLEECDSLSPRGDALYGHVKKNDDAELIQRIVKEVVVRFEGMEAKVKGSTKEEFISYCHSQLSGGIGMQIRNSYDLWNPQSQAAQYFITRNITRHPDAMCAEILKAVYATIVSTTHE